MPLRPRHLQAVFWTRAAVVAFLTLAATSTSARDTSTRRSSVNRDFLNAHFQAHLLQRDWLPQSSSSLSRSSSSADHAAAVENRETPPKNKVLFVTAIYGDYEKTLKEPAKQLHPADFVAFTDREYLSSPTWQIRLEKDPLNYLLKHGGRAGVGASVSSVAADAVVGSTEAASRGHGITETLFHLPSMAPTASRKTATLSI